MQLLAPKLTNEQVAIPLASVIDWPDVDERGLWNFDLDLIPWLASLKLNFAKVPSPPEKIERGKPVRARLRAPKTFPNVFQAARLRALNAVPVVTHLNYIGHHHGAYKAYPESAGKGDEAIADTWYAPRQIRLPCAACPVWKTIIAEYMADLASKGAREVSVWLSEHQGQCQCPTCLAAGQFRMETKAAYEGWLEARKQHPHLVLRIFYCLGGKSLDDTTQCLMELPPEIKLEHCYGRYSAAFDKAAAQGRWLATYSGPPLANAQFSGMRFYGATRTRNFVRTRLQRKWSAIYSINYVYSTAAYQKQLYDFHVSALAEWTWNLGGRTLADFARAWATRTALPHPDKFAQWVALIEPIERAHDAALRSRHWPRAADAIKARKPPRLARGLLAGIPNAAAFGKQLAECHKARQIAQAAGHQHLALEADYVAAFIRTLRALHTLQTQAHKGAAPNGLAGPLAEFRTAATDMAHAIDAKTDLLTAEPRAFAHAIKKLHADTCRQRVKAIADAIAQLR